MSIVLLALLLIIPVALALLSGKKFLGFTLLVGGFPITTIMPGIVFFHSFGGVAPQAALLFSLLISAMLFLLLNINHTARYLVHFYFCTIFILFIVASLFWGDDLIYGIRFIVKLVAPILFMFTAIIVCKTDKDVMVAERLVIICSLSVMALALANTLLGGVIDSIARVDWAAKNILTAPNMSPANFSFLMGAAAMLSLGNYLSRKSLGWLMLYVVFSGAILWAFTRISIAGWLVGTGVCVLLLVRSNMLKFIIPVAVGLVFIVSVLAVDSLRDRMFFSGKDIDLSASISDPGKLLGEIDTSGRSALWANVGDALGKNSAIFGGGIGSVDSWLARKANAVRMHSEYLRLYYDVGIIGLVLYLLIVFSLIRKMWVLTRSDDRDTRKLAAVAAASLTYYLITMATDNTLNYVTEFGLYVFVFAGLAFNANIRNSNHSIQTFQRTAAHGVGVY